MKKHVLLLIVSLLAVKSNLCAQIQASQITMQLVDIKGTPVEDKKYTEVVGDQYLQSDWANGIITFESNQSVAAPLKFDAYNNILLFKDKDGKELQPKNPIKSFTLDISDKNVSDFDRLTFLNGFAPIGKQNKDTYYQLVADGKIKLLKLLRKKIQEQSTFTSGVVTKTFKIYQSYFVVTDGKIMDIDPSKKSFIKSLSNHSSEIDAYLKNHKVNFDSDTDLRDFFAWYNSLN